MIFSSLTYIVFLLLVVVAYWRLPQRAQNFLLLIASYVFYGFWDWRFLSLILFSTIVDFIAGARIYDSQRITRKRVWLTISLLTNLSLLAYFKYANFFVDSLTQLFEVFGLSLSPVTLSITLPVGISFYTFQSLSYSIDIYHGRLRPIRSLSDFATFVAFFPQLVAGPIVRAREFLFQLEEERSFDPKEFESGVLRFVQGLFKKVVIADQLGIHLVDPVFADPSAYTAASLWLAMFGYAVQIYADFSGYSSMAIGSAKLLGFTIPENFLFPYLAGDISDFWRRWHVTMSRFFRDYVYIELGGNRGGFVRTLRNLTVTTLLSGLWHGAAWTFVAWGGWHGCLLAINQISRRYFPAKDGRFKLARAASAWLLTQLCVCIGWILFRAQSFGDVRLFISGLFSSQGELQTTLSLLLVFSFFAFVFDHIYGKVCELRKTDVRYYLPIPLKAVGYALLIFISYQAYSSSVQPFIYFDF